MKSYKYLEIAVMNSLEIAATDSQTLGWVVVEVKRLVPSCKVIDVARKNPLGEPYHNV